MTARLETRAGMAVVTIDDTGIGIDAEDAAHLFERLYRGRRARSLRSSGTGLGLAIARWIADAHGATIALSPLPDGGTRVEIKIPARPG